MEVLTNAVDKLSNSMRLYAEASVRFRKLFLVDKEEAINNLDRAFEAKLEAFHSVYDITSREKYIDYFNHADTAAMIMLRNAIHHRDHLLFRSWNSEMHLNGGLERMKGATFLLVGYDAGDALHVSQYYYKLEDFYQRLDTPRMSKSRKNLTILLNDDLKFGEIVETARKERYPLAQVYINVIPVFISAMSRLFTALLEQKIELKGYDSEVYSKHFSVKDLVDLSQPIYKELTIW